MPDELMRRAVECGIRKINFGTELKNAFTLAVRRSLMASDEPGLTQVYLSTCPRKNWRRLVPLSR